MIETQLSWFVVQMTCGKINSQLATCYIRKLGKKVFDKSKEDWWDRQEQNKEAGAIAK